MSDSELGKGRVPSSPPSSPASSSPEHGAVSESRAEFQRRVATLVTRGRYEDAEALYRQRLTTAPEALPLHGGLGLLLMKSGNYVGAIEQFQWILQRYPDDFRAHNNMANSLVELGRLDEARGYYQRAIELVPRQAEIRYNYGNLLVRLGETAAAVEQWEIALRDRPEWPVLLNRLASARVENPRASYWQPARAIELAAKAVELSHPPSAAMLLTLAQAYAADEQWDKAIEWARQARQGAEGAQSSESLIPLIDQQLSQWRQRQSPPKE